MGQVRELCSVTKCYAAIFEIFIFRAARAVFRAEIVKITNAAIFEIFILRPVRADFRANFTDFHRIWQFF